MQEHIATFNMYTCYLHLTSARVVSGKVNTSKLKYSSHCI